MDHVAGWPVVAKEFNRIARAAPRDYDPHKVEAIKQARYDAEVCLNQLDWERVYNFCERLHSHLASGAFYERNGEIVTVTKAQSQLFFAEEIQRCLTRKILRMSLEMASYRGEGSATP